MLLYSKFNSISGEVSHCPQGTLATFLRFAGCNLNCPYCDAAYTRNSSSGQEIKVNELINLLTQSNPHKDIIITGGEPLLQDHKELERLCKWLNHTQYEISVETNGSVPKLQELDDLVSYIFDYKLDYENKMFEPNFINSRQKDFIKFVITDKESMKRAMDMQCYFLQRGAKARFAYSPMIPFRKQITEQGFHNLRHRCSIICNKLEQEDLEAVVNVQLHKILNQR